jgi:DNA helicase-2/ATP-dependent DNA helicase PcrA
VALDLRSLLNEAQYTAATTTEGPLLILAGAGSGKTRVIVHRIAYMLEQRLATPWQIFAVTFTNKAAKEMRGRLEELASTSLSGAWIGTFHSMCARLLRIDGKRLGYDSSFSIYDEDDSKRVIKRAMEDLGIDTSGGRTSIAQVAHEIDRAKNLGTTAKTFAETETPFETPARKIARRVYPAYQRALAKANAMDFGDLILLSVELLRHHPEVRSRYSDRFRYLTVDEFQDTNKVQLALLRELTTEHQNLGVVGDDDQSIYRWRGADVSNILEFTRHYPAATVVKLEENYRSTGNILAAANAVIARNRRRHAKRLYTAAPTGDPIGLALYRTGEEEAAAVAHFIAGEIEGGRSPEDFAILYRANAQSRMFESALDRLRIPFTVIGGTAFFERMEVKDILAYLRLLTNPASTEDFERIVNIPARGIGKKSVERLRRLSEEHGRPGARVLDLGAGALIAGGLAKASAEKLAALGRLLDDLRELAETSAASDVAHAVVDRIGYEAHLEKEDPSSAEDRIGNVAELVSSIAEFESHLEASAVVQAEGAQRAQRAQSGGPALPDRDPKGSPLEEFLAATSLTTSEDRSAGGGAVSLLTLHSAKGLEFPVVVMVGLEEGTFPSKRALEGQDPEALEEERRLCYVGMTRAMQELQLTAVRYRRVYGTEEVRRASRFLGELPEEIVANLPIRSPQAPRLDAIFDGSPTSDDPPLEHEMSDMVALPPVRARNEPSEGAGGFAAGVRVHHDTFGLGVVEERERIGSKTMLRIRFGGNLGLKTVAARFVSLADDS